MRNKLMLLVGAVVILSGFGYLLYGGIGSNIVYFLSTSELRDRGAAVADTPLRLGGYVVPGSVQWNAAALDLRFRMSDGKTEVPVQSQGAPPQMFRDSMGVVVEGKLNREGVFEATNLMIKHSNEYKPPPAGQARPEELYRSLVEEESK